MSVRTSDWPMSDPIHVVDATMFWSRTGGGVRRYLLAKHAWMRGRAGWRHTIAVPGGSTADDMATLPAMALPFSGGYRLPLRRAATARVLASLRPDLIEAGDPYRVAWSARDAASALGIPAVAYCHSNLEAMARLMLGRGFDDLAARTARRYLRHVYAGFDLVLAPSRDMLGRLVEAGIDRAACQPLGVDTAVFHPSRASIAWRTAHGLDAEARVLVYAGRFAPEKHLDMLADAVALLGAPYVFVAIGAGPNPPPAGDRVRILPFLSGADALATALASADAFVHAGDQETFGLSALEALACGTPIVVPDAAGLGELATVDAGVAVHRRDSRAFADAIAAVFERDRQSWRVSARARAEPFEWDRVFTDLTGHYARLVAGDPPMRRRTAPSCSTASATAADTNLSRSTLSSLPQP